MPWSTWKRLLQKKWPVIDRDTFSKLAPVLDLDEKNWICRPLPLFIAISMILKHVIFELLLLRAAFVGDEIWGDA